MLECATLFYMTFKYSPLKLNYSEIYLEKYMSIQIFLTSNYCFLFLHNLYLFSELDTSPFTLLYQFSYDMFLQNVLYVSFCHNYIGDQNIVPIVTLPSKWLPRFLLYRNIFRYRNIEIDLSQILVIKFIYPYTLFYKDDISNNMTLRMKIDNYEKDQ